MTDISLYKNKICRIFWFLHWESLSINTVPYVTNSLYPVQVGQEIEVRPGIVSKDEKGKLRWEPICSVIVSLFAEQNDLQYAVPGGLIGRFCF